MIDIREYLDVILAESDGETVITAIVGALSSIAEDPKVSEQGIDISEELGIELSNEEYDTLNGLVFHELGSIPEDGSTIEIDIPILGSPLCSIQLRHGTHLVKDE